MVKHSITNIGGSIVKQDDRYVVRDNPTLTNLVLSSTNLNPEKQTTGHAHAGQEEVYIFVGGSGEMILIDTNGKHHDTPVATGDIVLIPDGWFHRVCAGPDGCDFVCVFDGRRGSKS